ncbi:Fungal specific transcription factor domain [Ceratobasidium sp. AG-Ba]|nr:Fungal specific transcription factor domain [Ceratobasidium sp. AG-Ba]
MDLSNMPSCSRDSISYNNHIIVEQQTADDLQAARFDSAAFHNHFDPSSDSSLLLDPSRSLQPGIPGEVHLWLSSDSFLRERAQFANDLLTQGGTQSSLVHLTSSNITPQQAEVNWNEAGALVARRASVWRTLPRPGHLEAYQMTSSNGNTLSHEEPPMESNTESRDESDTEDEGEDLEGVMEVIKPMLRLDLSLDVRSMARSMFEPTTKVDMIKGFLTQRCTTSDDLRHTATLIATAADLLDKNVELIPDKVAVIALLENRLCSQLAVVKTRLETRPELYTSDAFMAMWHMYEMTLIRCFSGSMAFHVRMLDQIVPVYQLAYLGAPRTPIRLHAQLFHPNRILRQPPAADILLSLSTCRPMIFQYDTAIYKPEFELDQIGMQWKTGVPDQFLILLAQMNTLRQDYAPNIAFNILNSIETQIAQFEPGLNRTSDSRLYIARVVVQECWRQFMYIYLYMGLCGDNSYDIRVRKALKRFVKVLDRVQPGRAPDAFVVTPMNLAGIAASTTRDRNIIRQHFRSLCEYFQWGSYVNDAALILETIWATSDAENRPAVWSDLRLACEAVTGIV